MKRTDNRKDAPRRTSNEGTAARTRPLSFEEIMSRRKDKHSGGNKEAVDSLMGQSTRGDAKGALDNLEAITPDKGMKDVRDKARSSSKKTKEMVYKREGEYSERSDKLKLNSEVSAKSRSGNSKSSRDKESKNEKQSHQNSRDGDRMGAGFEKENEKKHPKHTGKDKIEERGRKPRGEMKTEERDYPGEMDRLEIDGFNSKRHDSRRSNHNEHTERNDRRKDDFRSYREGPRPKRRRSWSREHERERHRSLSSSPRAHKQAYRVHDHRESSPQYSRQKSGRKYSDGDAHKTSGNGGYGTGHYRKHRSGLGGYSPRKRRSEAAIRTPSPVARSPDRKKSTWDQPPSDANNSDVQHMKSDIHSSFSKTNEMTSTFAATTVAKAITPVTSVEIASMISTSIDSIHLTQSTRPMRRLYIENLPASASEKTIVDCFNEFLLSNGANHIKGTSPCISCLINKEKNQALVEFLTPQDATAAISFDGSSLSGSIVKVRRPKDFFEAPTETKEKQKEEVKAISSVVKDSPHKALNPLKEITTIVKNSPDKIFVGGFSEVFSSTMIMEIVSAFGALKAYHFEFNEELNAPCVFLEYLDHSITLKACAGLNGMKLGGKIITAVQAFPDTLVDDENVDTPSTYDIPIHAKSLLAASTKVLKLKNLLNREEFLQLSESELEDIMDDIKLECARFGSVKSLNIIRHVKDPVTVNITSELYSNEDTTAMEPIRPTDIGKGRHYAQDMPSKSMVDDGSVCEQPQCITDLPGDQREQSSMSTSTEAKDLNGANDLVAELSELRMDTKGKSVAVLNDNRIEASLSNNGDDALVDDANPEGTAKDEAIVIEECINSSVGDLDKNTSSEKVGVADKMDGDQDGLFEPGSVLVEFLREEASCMAAHSLHGRTYGEHVITAGFVPHDLYLQRFPR